MEKWMPVSVNNNYSVSNLGRMWSVNKGILKTPLNNSGYPHFNICTNGKPVRTLVHRVVATAFIPNPENKPCVNHLHAFNILGKKNNPHPKTQKALIAYKEGLPIVLTFSGIRECGRFLNIPYQGIQNCIKFSGRTYFGWLFELI